MSTTDYDLAIGEPGSNFGPESINGDSNDDNVNAEDYLTGTDRVTYASAELTEIERRLEAVPEPTEILEPLSALTAQPAAGWTRWYRSMLSLSDAASAALACVIANWVHFGGTGGSGVGLIFATGVPALWMATLATTGAYDRRALGGWGSEFQRVFRGFLQFAGALVFVLYALDVHLRHSTVVVTLVGTAALDFVGRVVLQGLRRRAWATGRGVTSILAVGEPAAVLQFVEYIQAARTQGARIVGACLPDEANVDGADAERLARSGVKICGGVDNVRASATSLRVRTVAVLPGALNPNELRRVSWQLEGTLIGLATSPGVAEVSGRRMRVCAVAGLPLISIDQAKFEGVNRVLKGVLDRAVAALALLLLSPALLIISMLVMLTSTGPALYTQTRIGKNGKPFRMVKFRSMYTGADAMLAELGHLNEASDGVLFKIRADPRVTRVGRVLRRFSLDELPQLLNVLAGSMSLVGPRPPLPVEVSSYPDEVKRRLLVKPGMTGLWQVSGRSNLSWEESVRLDLRYVENWSLSLDLLVLWKTVRAVARAEGAY